MKKRLVIMLAMVLAAFVLATTIALAYGNNFSFPAARRIAVSQGYSGTHQAYDYSFTTHTAVAAAKAGTVTASGWGYADGWNSGCTGLIGDRGNYIVLTHASGLETLYFHLSNTGNTPGVNTYFYQGAPMALSDDTGCSDQPHLHFVAKLNGTPFDPYAGTTDWVSGVRIPMGYRNQNGTTNGPYALDKIKIHDKWLALEGKPGSPLEDDWTYVCYIQTFEQGRISDCGSGSATYVEFTKTYLPDIRTRYSMDSGWNSSIVVHNNSSVSAKVNITIYKSDGIVLDTRTYNGLGAGATWTLNVWDVVFDTSLGYGTGIFEGSAVVAADQDVSAVVVRYRTTPYVIAAYTGIASPASTIRLPQVNRNNYGWQSDIAVMNTGSSSTTAYVYFQSSSGEICEQTLALAPNAATLLGVNTITCLGSDYANGARINGNGQSLTVVTTMWTDSITSVTDYEGFPNSFTPNYYPLLMKENYGWSTGIMLQNPNPTANTVTLNYYNSSGSSWSESVYVPANSAKSVYPLVPPPSGFVGTGRGTGASFLSNVNQINHGYKNASSYAASGGGTSTAIAPLFAKAYSGWGQGGQWSSGMNIQNVGANTATVEVKFYNPDGTQNGSTVAATIPANASYTLYPAPVSAGFLGSAVVTANQPIAVVVNTFVPGATSDSIMTYSALNR